ncbi:hypothetical protein BD413DRAFT_492299 [Trametes elegans]|nr:hypothetical protein BD413DRAFT_492299 [Trametes elegans]
MPTTRTTSSSAPRVHSLTVMLGTGERTRVASPGIVKKKDISPLNQCPPNVVQLLSSTQDIQDALAKMSKSPVNDQDMLFTVEKLLMKINGVVYKHLSSLPEHRQTGHQLERFSFIRHQPEVDKGVNGRNSTLPQIVGCCPSVDRETCPTYPRVPFHLIETVVEADVMRNDDDTSDAASDFLRQLLRNRPERVAMYGLSVHRRGFIIHYADNTGAWRSGVTPWDPHVGLQKLAHYVHSLYLPPAHHFLRDTTMTRKSNETSTWSFDVNGEQLTDGRALVLGHLWGKRNSIFLARHGQTRQAIIKDCHFLFSPGKAREPEFLKHIHCRGFMPGLVRLAFDMKVKFGKEEKFMSVKDSPQVKHRMVLADLGDSLLLAKTVNDLLMAVYDTLEVHRTVARRMKVLHRDMSIANILMYPKWGQFTNEKVIEDPPVLIDDILGGVTRLASTPGSGRLLQQQVGTPQYVARAVAMGHPVFARHTPLRMPTLSGEAKEMYIRAYGPTRYDTYCDGTSTFHGGTPAELDEPTWESAERTTATTHYLRWEYDVESVYWTMYSVLLRVLPKGFIELPGEATRIALEHYWGIFHEHNFGSADKHPCENLLQDTRTPLLDCDPVAFARPFAPGMQDAARLLFDIAQHVRIPYVAMATPPTQEDHLHEAVQRLILDYLVRHRDDPVVLTPGRLRTSYAPKPLPSLASTYSLSSLMGINTSSSSSSVDSEASRSVGKDATQAGAPGAVSEAEDEVVQREVGPLFGEYPYFDTKYELGEPSDSALEPDD